MSDRQATAPVPQGLPCLAGGPYCLGTHFPVHKPSAVCGFLAKHARPCSRRWSSPCYSNGLGTRQTQPVWVHMHMLLEDASTCTACCTIAASPATKQTGFAYPLAGQKATHRRGTYGTAVERVARIYPPTPLPFVRKSIPTPLPSAQSLGPSQKTLSVRKHIVYGILPSRTHFRRDALDICQLLLLRAECQHRHGVFPLQARRRN